MPDDIRKILYMYVKENSVTHNYDDYILYVHAKKMLSMPNKDVMIEYYNKHIRDKNLSYNLKME